MKKNYAFYEITGESLSRSGDIIRLNMDDMEKKMLVSNCIGIPTAEDLQNLKISNFEIFADDDYIGKEKLNSFYTVVNLSDHKDLKDFLGSFWGNIEDEDLEKAGFTRKEVLEILQDNWNKVNDFDYDLITLPYWDGSNWDKLYIYDNLDFYNCHVDAECDGSSSLDPEEQSNLNRLEEIEYYKGNTYSNTLYKSPSGKYYLKEDSFWQGEYSNIFDIYTEVEESELPSILKEKFKYSRGEIDDFFKKKVAITA